MHGNILDANSTSKLVKDAIENSIIEGNYATKDLLENEIDRATNKENILNDLIENETSARSSKDTELENSIAQEKTRAQNKEKEISDKLAIVDGDSNTEGSFRKAIADVIAAAPEDLDTLKEIADKLAGNDDLHTALNQAITEKADASALANEVTRATGAESGLQAAIANKADPAEIVDLNQQVYTLRQQMDTKVDTFTLSNYVLKTALNQQVDTLNTAISAKQDKGNYIPYTTNNGSYIITSPISVMLEGRENVTITTNKIIISGNLDPNSISIKRDELMFDGYDPQAPNYSAATRYTINGITSNKYNNCLATSDGTFKPISDFVLSSAYNEKIAALEARIAALEAKHTEAAA